VQTAAIINQGPEIKRPEVKGGIIEDSLCLRISGLQNLEAPVQEEALHSVGAHPPADPIRGLKDNEGNAGLMQRAGATQPCQASADDADVHADDPLRESVRLRAKFTSRR
jgi:hypothetical protein